ncbi:hypothetical protein T4B_3426 [Trichinella pseudospiralis]|uniref:Uncharacterized protein n=2 Tax=Trichinella pseudospiralis TaxID=6337 RepID=A0A0V0XWW7_TRIPS|nr:hypothetical protein T4E_8986 [Trichinella pseudospiralis]KRY83890.1 hypothetical protein T4D_6044 [Trichinella pseudospiralis]KRZ26029.1 hypothetical protein T4B_3426 [Trichinella pseudospiralis]KRZ31353.1 hypothetical protein T4C_9996 [Trichinella pseudospiralis]
MVYCSTTLKWPLPKVRKWQTGSSFDEVSLNQIPAKSLVLNGWTCTGQRGRSTALWPLLLWRRANGQRPGSFEAANFYRCVPSPAHS